MSGSNQFLAFGTGVGANVLTPAAYAAMSTLGSGFEPGLALSQQCNTVWRQASFVTSVLAQLMADVTGQAIQDNGNAVTFEQQMALMLALVNYGVDSGSVNTYAVTFAPTEPAIADGLRLRFKAANGNTGASTFNPNSLGALPIYNKKHSALVGGEILAGSMVEIVLDMSLNGGSGAWVLVLVTNSAADLLNESSISTIATTGGSTTLTPAQYANGILNFTGTLTSNATIILPTLGSWIVANNTNGNYSLTVTTASGTGTQVVTGAPQVIYGDGTNIDAIVGGGATGSGSDRIFNLNGQTVNNSYTIPTGDNAMSAGPITIASGVTVTVPTGSTWSVV